MRLSLHRGFLVAAVSFTVLTMRSTVAAAVLDIRDVAPDLTVPAVELTPPGAGKRVKMVLPDYEQSAVYHVLYLPADWTQNKRYPVIVEYAGNGPFQNAFGDISTGRPEGSKLGYGISGGEGYIWICPPYVSPDRTIQTSWWGDVELTLDYCRKAVRLVCEEYGGDPAAVFLAGFSRGAIGCGYLGLHDDTTADIWLGFIPYSHYDGVNEGWGYAGADRASARARLQRIGGRASFICSEPMAGTFNVAATRTYVESTGVEAAFTFRELGFRNHNDAWTLRPSEDRAALRSWIRQTLAERPGTRAVRGRVTNRAGEPIAGVRVESGFTHFAFTGEDGRYELSGLPTRSRPVGPSDDRYRFEPAARNVQLIDQDLVDVNFIGQRLPEVRIHCDGGDIVVEFDGVLEGAIDPAGPWSELAEITSPWTILTPDDPQLRFLRLKIP